MTESAQSILKNQKMRLAIAIGCAVILLIALYLTMGDQDYSIPLSHTPKSAIALPGDKIDAQEVWRSQIETQNQSLESKSLLIEQKLEFLQNILLDQKKKEEESEKEKIELKKEIQRLKGEIRGLAERPEPQIPANSLLAYNASDQSQNLKTPSSFPIVYSPNQPLQDPFTVEGPQFDPGEVILEEIKRPPLIEVVMEEGPSERKKRKVDLVNEKIFAGTTVKALLVSSVDAVCGVFSSTDPVPVKLRILDDGHLPKHLTAKLKGGLIIGSAYGNLSNERVYIRLERMSLFNAKGEGVEMEVAGYVSGEDGRFGIRGLVIDKSGQMVKNAAYSGVLSGTGQVLQSAVSKKPIDCWNTYSVGTDILKQGGAAGAGNAFDMLADYYIKRAEQIQPVVQVNAGRVVDVTFTYGNTLGDVHVKEAIKETRLRNQGGLR